MLDNNLYLEKIGENDLDLANLSINEEGGLAKLLSSTETMISLPRQFVKELSSKFTNKFNTYKLIQKGKLGETISNDDLIVLNETISYKQLKRILEPLSCKISGKYFDSNRNALGYEIVQKF